MKHRIAILALVVLLCGCATQNAVFVTKTSLSVLDLDTTPPGASLAFDRVEGYIGPRFDDGTVYPVTGSLRTSGEGMQREIHQLFAGGKAALLVLRDKEVSLAPKPCTDELRNPPLLFVTGTTLGIKLGFAEGTPLPNSFVLGYRRKEAAFVPVSKECQPSVLATFDSETQARSDPAQPKLQGGITQYFATGAAADELAQVREVRNLFRSQAIEAVGNVAAFNQREAAQTRLALDVLTCVGKVPDDGFARVVNNAEDLALIDDGAAARVRAGATPAEQRRRYAEFLSLRLGESDEYGSALHFHHKRVCAIATPG